MGSYTSVRGVIPFGAAGGYAQILDEQHERGKHAQRPYAGRPRGVHVDHLPFVSSSSHPVRVTLTPTKPSCSHPVSVSRLRPADAPPSGRARRRRPCQRGGRHGSLLPGPARGPRGPAPCKTRRGRVRRCARQVKKIPGHSNAVRGLSFALSDLKLAHPASSTPPPLRHPSRGPAKTPKPPMGLGISERSGSVSAPGGERAIAGCACQAPEPCESERERGGGR